MKNSITVSDIHTWYRESPVAKKITQFGEWFFNLAMISYLIYEIYQIGVEDTIKNMPTSVGFYILFFVMFFMLPISEYFIYKLTWNISFFSSFKAFLLKKIYNKSLVGYSGDLFLGLWASKNLSISKTEAFHLIKDNAIVSTIGSTLFAILILVIFILFGNIPSELNLSEYIIYSSIILIIVISILGLFPKKIVKKVFKLGLNVSLKIISIHFLRLFILGILQIYQWHLVINEVSLDVWITYIALQVITTKIPFIPNRDLIFLALGIQLADLMLVPQSAIAALLIVNSLLDKLVNFIIYLVLSVAKKF